MNCKQSSDGLIKVKFYDPVVGYENIWALPIAADKYRIENIPFFIYDLSLGDVVEATNDENGDLCFRKVLERSENRTLRARSDSLISNPDLGLRIARDLEDLKCKVEIHRDRLLAISVPPTLNITVITDYLTGMVLDWEYGSPSQLNN